MPVGRWVAARRGCSAARRAGRGPAQALQQRLGAALRCSSDEVRPVRDNGRAPDAETMTMSNRCAARTQGICSPNSRRRRPRRRGRRCGAPSILRVDATQFPPLEDGEFYVCDIVGAPSARARAARSASSQDLRELPERRRARRFDPRGATARGRSSCRSSTTSSTRWTRLRARCA